MSEQIPPSATDVVVSFCKSGCWKTSFVPENSPPRIKGEDVAAQLAASRNMTLESMMSGQNMDGIVEECAVRFHGVPCMGSCGDNPSARVKSTSKPSTYFKAETPEAVVAAVQKHLAAATAPETDRSSD